MKKEIQLVPVKFVVSSTMKAKLKATAALNDTTLRQLFMDAVLEKYPFLISNTSRVYGQRMSKGKPAKRFSR